jgi:hypothetical protein
MRAAERRAARLREVRERDGLRGLAEQMRGEAAAGRLPPDLAETASSELSGGGHPIVSFHPSIESRLARLRAMGAHVEGGERRSRAAGLTVGGAGLALLVGALLVLAGGLMVVALTLMLGLVCFFMLIYVLLVYMIFAAINGLPFL